MSARSVRMIGWLVLVIGATGSAPAQDAREQAERALDKNELYLARKPYQDWALDKLIESAVALNRLDDLVQRYEARVAAEPKDDPGRIVLARLYARVDRLDQALEVLAPLAERTDAELGRLRGELLMKAGKPSDASLVLDAAALATSDPKLLESIHGLRGEAFLARGDRAGAQQAFHALAELDPESFSARMAAGETLARHGLAEEAIAEYTIAKRLAGEDSARACRALAEIGRLDEQLGRGGDALAAYAEAIAQMARGNWLKRELEERILALHERTGELAKLVEHARVRVQTRPDDLDARELLARALEKSGARDEALAILDRAVQDFAADPALSQHRRDLLRSLGRTDDLVAEYQRILVEHPEELELHLELGQLFASEGRLEQARVQWNRTLEGHLDDAGLCSRLAGFYALHDHTEDALAMYERAITIEPEEITHYADLVRFLARADRGGEIPAWLERAEERGASRSTALEEVAALWNESGHPERGRATLERALALEGGDDARLLGVLAQALVDAGDFEAAAATLYRVIDLTADSNQRANAADRLIGLFRKREKLDELLALEEQRLARGESKESALLVLAKLHLLRRESDRALERLTELLALDASNETARLLMARLHEESGDLALALADYEKLSELRPQNRRRYLKEMAKIHLALFDQEQAFACYDEILRSAPDNPAVFQEVADAYERLGLHEKVVELLLQAVRLRPEDGGLRLALAETYATLGEREKARVEVRAAIASPDAETRAKACDRYYSMLAEAGEVEDEIVALRGRIETNPYDVEAPLLLADLYVRESEYGLALEMLDGLLAYQPREPRLLTERAKLCVLVERHDEAIRDLETLWKLPDSDRDHLGLAIAGAALASGDRERATVHLASIEDPMRVARFWSEHEEPREAVAVLEQALQRAPGDPHVARELVKRLIEIGEREEAASQLERLVDSGGDTWSTLVQLGEVCHALGRSEEVIACGRRLFALLRVEEEKSEREEREQQKSDPYVQVYGTGWRGPAIIQRISALQTYFSSKGMNEQFGRLGAEEVLLQPTNSSLMSMVISSLTRQDGQGPLVRKTVAAVREATLGKGRLPPGIDAEGWERSLASWEMGCYRKDAAFAGERIAELAPGVEAGTASEREVLELATLCSIHRREGEQIAALEAALARTKDSKLIAAGLASAWLKQKEYAKAAEVLETLLPTFDESAARDERERKFEKDLPRSSMSLQARLPVQARRRATDADLLRILHVQRTQPFTLSWGPGETIYPQAVRRALATCYAKTARPDEARTMLRTLEPEEPESFSAWAQIANAYYEEELYPEAETIYRRLLDLEQQLSRDPILGWLPDWTGQLATPMANYARILERRGELVEAYDLLRTYGDPNAAQLLLHTHGAYAGAREHYRTRMETEEARWNGEAEADKRAWREAAVRLAETFQFEKEWDPMLATYERVAAELPGDMEVRDLVAALHLKAGRADRAVEERRAIIRAKRELNRKLARQETPPGRKTIPQPLPHDDEQDEYVWSNLRSSSAYSSSWQSTGVQAYDLTGDYAAILKIHLDRRELPEAARILRDLAREDAQTFRWLRYSLAEILRAYRFGSEALPVYRLMQSTDSSDDSFDVEYAQALAQAGDLEEARRILVRTVSRSTDEWQLQDARARLTEIERRMGTGESGGLAELEAAVAADPKSIKKRMELARKLFEERRVEEALVHARAAEEQAPNQEEARDLVMRCHQVLGHHEEVEARVLAAFEQATDPSQSVLLATRLANWMWERGERERADLVFERAARLGKQSWRLPTPAAWYFERGDYAKARVWLEKSVESAKQSGVISSQDPKQDLVRLRFLQGDGTNLLLEELRELAARETMAEKLALVPGFVQHVAKIPQLADQRTAIEAACASEGALHQALLEAAIALADRDIAGAERVLSVHVQSDAGARFLYPFLVTLARARKDWRSALTYLEAIEREGLASPTMQVSTRIGALSEHQALQAEMGDLLVRLGEVEPAHERWNALFEADDPQSKRRLATLYAESELPDLAIRALREYLADNGERSEEDLEFLAELCEKTKRFDEQIAALRKCEVLMDKSESYEARPLRASLLRAYRRAGKLPELRDELVRALEKDPDDSASQRELLAIHVELGEEEAARTLLERLVEDEDAESTLVTFLAEEKRASGDVEGAMRLYERVLAGKGDEWERMQQAQRLAGMLAHKGEIDRAIQVVLQSKDDPESAEAALDLAQQLRAWKRPEEALVYFRKGLALTESQPWWNSSLLDLLVELGRKREALDAFYASLAEGEETAYFSTSVVAALAQELGERERLEAALASAPEDPTLLLRAGIVAYSLADTESATARFETLLERDPEDRIALQWLLACHERAKRRPEALALCERLLPLLDRDRALLSRSNEVSRQVETLRQTRIQLLLQEGRIEEARAASADRLGRRYEDLDVDGFDSFHPPTRDMETYARTCRTEGLWDEALRTEQEIARLQGRENPQSVAHAFLRKGEVDRAEAILWAALEPPASGLFGQSPSDAYQMSAFGYSGFDAADPTRTLLEIAREKGSVDAFLQELERFVAAHPEEEALVHGYESALQESGRWESLLAFVEKQFQPEDRGPEELAALALVHERLGHWEQAIQFLEQQDRLVRAAHWSGEGGWHANVSSGAPTAMRFTWGAQGSRPMSSYSTSRSMSQWYPNGGQDRQVQLIALHAKIGHSERAAELEREYFARLDPEEQDPAWPWRELAMAHSKLELWKEAEEYLRRGLAAVDPEDRASLHEALTLSCMRRGDAEGQRAALADWIALLDERSLQAPFDAAILVQRAHARSRFGEDGAAARADLERALALQPGIEEYSSQVAWIHLELGEAEQALAIFRRMDNHPYHEEGPDTDYGLGLAEAQIEGIEAARPRLRRALAEDPDHPAAARVRALLQ